MRMPPTLEAVSVRLVQLTAEPASGAIVAIGRNPERSTPGSVADLLDSADLIALLGVETGGPNVDRVDIPDGVIMLAGFSAVYVRNLTAAARLFRVDVYGTVVRMSDLDRALLARRSGTEGG